MNFCEFPLATLSDRVPGGQKTLEFEDTLKYGGKEVSRKLTITASDKYGLPTSARNAFDARAKGSKTKRALLAKTSTSASVS